MFGPGIL